MDDLNEYVRFLAAKKYHHGMLLDAKSALNAKPELAIKWRTLAKKL